MLSVFGIQGDDLDRVVGWNYHQYTLTVTTLFLSRVGSSFASCF